MRVLFRSPNGQPLVLGRQDAVIARDLTLLLVELRVVLDERLTERADRDGVLDAADAVADPDLDGRELRMRPDVPPDVRVVGNAARVLEITDHLGVVRIVPEARRRAGPRERGEDRLPGGREPCGLSPPEGRARRETEQ